LIHICDQGERISIASPFQKKGNATLAIVGPKGGVGKSIISANLAIALSNTGKRVIAVDLDLGAANLHAILGVRESKYTLDDFVMNKVNDLSQVVSETGVKNLGIICGGDVPGIANMPYQRKMKLIGHLLKLDSEIIILDLGAGASNNVVDFLIIAQRGLIVTTPEVPSLLNVYSFIKTTIFRRLAFHYKNNNSPGMLDLLENARNPEQYPRLKMMEGFLEEAQKIDGKLAESTSRLLEGFFFFIVVNRVQKSEDANAGAVIQNLMRKYLNITSSTIMTIREDDEVRGAVAKLTPIMLENPTSTFSLDIMQIAGELYCN
jgi:flagellar biosynthesis protein FlhG